MASWDLWSAHVASVSVLGCTSCDMLSFKIMSPFFSHKFIFEFLAEFPPFPLPVSEETRETQACQKVLTSCPSPAWNSQTSCHSHRYWNHKAVKTHTHHSHVYTQRRQYTLPSAHILSHTPMQKFENYTHTRTWAHSLEINVICRKMQCRWSLSKLFFIV